jgi:Domain of unknown function (DUF3387)
MFGAQHDHIIVASQCSSWLLSCLQLGSSIERRIRGFNKPGIDERRASVGAQLRAHHVADQPHHRGLMTVVIRLAQRVRMEIGSPDISGVLADVERLLEASVDATPFVIDAAAVERVDLTQIDFDVLATLFASGKSATATARLRASLERRIERMLRVNPSRIDYAERLRELIDRYNTGAMNTRSRLSCAKCSTS